MMEVILLARRITMYNNLYTNLLNKKFSDIFTTVEEFVTQYKTSPIPTVLTDDELNTLYYLLYSRYGNSTIASSDENRFKFDLYATIFSYAPSWSRKVKLQESLRNLTDAELREGSFAKHNHAFNPSTEPTTEVLENINEQNTSDFQKDKMTAYATLNSILATDVTQSFLDKFNKLFRKGVILGVPIWYISDEN